MIDPVEYALGLVRKAKAYNPEEEDEPVAFPILFHSGVGDPNEIRKGIEPRFGDWVGEVLSGATDEEIDPEESYVPLAYFDSEPNWVTAQAGRKGGISIPDVTLDDVRKYGQLAVIYNVDDKYGGAINKVFKIGPDGYNGGYTKVTDVEGREMNLYETGLEEEGFQPKTLFGVEPGDIISNESITPDVVLTGDDLVRFMKQYYKEFGMKSRREQNARPSENPRKRSLRQFPYQYAAYLKAKFPDIWRAGGNIRGNDTFKWWTKYRKGDRSPTVVYWWETTRPAWIARHFNDHRLPGVIAQIKWGAVGKLGVAGMKKVVEDAIRRRYAN